jgi:hypothetical protein
MLKSQLIAALLLVLTPLVAWSTMTVGWGPNRTYWVNGYEGIVFYAPSILSVDPEYISFGNGGTLAKEMRSTILFDSDSDPDHGVEVKRIVSANWTEYVDDGIEEIAQFFAVDSSCVEVYFVGDYKQGQNWVETTNAYETSFITY